MLLRLQKLKPSYHLPQVLTSLPDASQGICGARVSVLG